MEQLVNMICEKTGISKENATTAVNTVTSFIKDKLPAGMQGQLDSIISGGAGSLGGLADGVKDKIGGMFGK